jgi:mannose-6-phosphate isomerase-like protein (cupin superfamily)
MTSPPNRYTLLGQSAPRSVGVGAPRHMTYTIKNLRQVEDVAPSFGFSEVQEARFARGDLEAETIGLAFHTVRPGRRQAFAHRHRDAEEIYVVLSGFGQMKLDDDIIDVGPMDAIRVSPEVARAFEAGPDGLELLVFGPRHAGDGEVIREDFWADAS